MKPNILLIILDSVRARNTGLHGHVHDTTPFLQEFADSATWYQQTRAPGTTSITSHTSIFTGLAVAEHRVSSPDTRLRPGTTVFDWLDDEYDYETGVFSENVWITDVDIGLSRAFDTVVGPQDVPYPDAVRPRSFVSEEGTGEFVEYVCQCLRDDQSIKGLVNGIYTKVSSDFPSLIPERIVMKSQGDRYVDEFFSWLDSNVSNSWAACVNLMDAHLPYRPKDQFNKWGDDLLRDIENNAADQWELHCGDGMWWRRKARETLYDGAILQADNYTERIVRGLEQRGILDNTLVVITSDHGEGFGERSHIRPARVAGHNVSVHEVLLHVPLVVKHPRQEQAAEVESVATLTEFPAVVKEAVDGTETRGSFVPNRPVVASSHRIEDDENLKSRALEYCDDLSAFESYTHVVYEGKGIVKKYVTWKEREATIEIRSAQDSYKIADAGGERVSSVFEEMEVVDVREDSRGLDNIDTDTYERLEKLGYV